MAFSMILAHFVGDYVLQWNRLAAWKARAMSGVIVHSLIVTAVTISFALIYDPNWWPWALFISIMHFFIDAFGLKIKLPISAFGRFIVDQIAHFVTIFVALAAGGYIETAHLSHSMLQGLREETIMLYLLGYVFVTMPAWVVVKFTAYGLVKGCAPEFRDNSKYLGIMERLLIVTFVAFGQFLLVPMVLLPRFLMEWPQAVVREQTAVYIAELLVSIILAVMVGLIFYLM